MANHDREIESLDAEIAKISKSTRASSSLMVPLHDILRHKYSWYYKWHLSSYSSKIHSSILICYVLLVAVGIYFGYTAKPGVTLAAGACTATATGTWHNNGGTATWSGAGCTGTGGTPGSDADIAIDTGVTVTMDGTGSTTGSFSITGNLTTGSNALSVGALTVNTGGTLNASGSPTITASGNWNHSAGTFTRGSSTIVLTGASVSFNTGGSSKPITNLQTVTPGQTVTLSNRVWVEGTWTVGAPTSSGGKVTVNGNQLVDLANETTPIVFQGTYNGTTDGYNINSTNQIDFYYTTNGNIPSGTYPNVYFRNEATATSTLQGNITVNGFIEIKSLVATKTHTLDTSANNYSITTTGNSGTLKVGDSTANTKYSILKANNSAITVSYDLYIYASDASGTNEIQAGGSSISVSRTWSNADTFTCGTGTVTFTGNSGAHQVITTNGNIFNNLTLNNTQATYDQVIISGNLDVNGNLTVTDGKLKMDTYNPTVTTAKDVSIASTGSLIKGTGTWTFDGVDVTQTYTDNSSSAPQNLGAVTLNLTNTDVQYPTTMATNMKVDTLTLGANNFLNLGSAHTLEIANAGATATVLTFNANSNLVPSTSTVKFTATNSSGNISIPINTASARTYYNLQLSPGSAETYDMAANLTGTNALTGSLSIDANATLTTGGGSNYSITAAGITVSGVLDCTSSAPTITDTGNWVTAGTFTAGSSTVVFSKTSSTQTLNTGGVGAGKLFNNFTHSGAGTLQLITNALDVNGIFTNSAGTFDANGLNLNVADDFLISGGLFSAGSTPGTQTVTFDSTAEATVSGSTTFNNLTMDSSVGGAKTIKFTAGTTQTITSGKTWTLNGASGKVLTLRSTSDGVAWGFIIYASFTSGTYIDVKDSQNTTNANRITPGANVTNSGNNSPGWLFNQPPVNDSVDFTNPYSGTTKTAVSDDTTSWNFQAKVTDPDGPTDINYIEIRFANGSDSTLPYDSLKFRYTRGTDTFSEVADTQDSATITSTTGDATSSGNQWTVNFKIKLNANFTVKDTDYNIELYSIDNSAASDDDDYASKYRVTQLAISLDVDSDLIAFGNLLPGSILTGTTITTVTTNYPNGYTLAVKDGVVGNNSVLRHTDTTTYIADYAGTIATPTLWSGTGLGICVYDATDKDTSKWGTGTTETDALNKYAGVPENNGTINTKTGVPTTGDEAYIGYKLVVPTTQKTGDYSGEITYTATGTLP